MTSRLVRPQQWLLGLSLPFVMATVGCVQPPVAEAQPGILAFDRRLQLEQTAEASANVSIGDVNADGHLDIVLVKGRHWPLVDLLLIGDGRGAFSPARPIGEADRSYSGVLVDIDGDGDLDVVISNDTPDPKRVHLNDGTGEFSVGSTFGQPEWSTRHVGVVDVNGDGRPDIIVANRTGDSSGLNYVCYNRGDGRFDGDCNGFAGESATTITPADFNRDGHIDLAVPHREGGQSYIYLNDATGKFSERIAFGPADAAIRQSEAADLNGDGILDLVVIDERKGAAFHLGQPDGTFVDARPLGTSGPTPYAMAIADLNEDGKVDVIVGYITARPVALFGDGKGGFTPVEFGDDQGTAYGFAVGDVNEDGFTDIAMARSDAPNMLYFGRPVKDQEAGAVSSDIEFANDTQAKHFSARMNDATAVLDYQFKEPVIILTSTDVPESMRGAGVAGQLVRYALEYSRGHSYEVVPLCPFVAGWIRRHPEFRDVVPERFRYLIRGDLPGRNA
jgi:predicted GNAT family acetyltransferase